MKIDWKKIFPTYDKLDRETFGKLETEPRRWGLLPTLDCYILREFMIKLSVLLLVFTLIFIMNDVFSDLGDFLNAKMPLHSMLVYFALKIPGNIRFVLPISMLLGCMWTMAAFGKNQEITAMRAGGVSLFRCAGSIFVVGLIVTGINIYFNEALVPYTERKAKSMADSISPGHKDYYDKVLVYRSPDGRRSWCFPRFRRGGVNEDVTLKVYAGDGKTIEWELQAANVYFDRGTGWYFSGVQRTTYINGGLMPRSPEHIESLFISKDEAPERPGDIDNSIKDEEELPSWVIFDILNRTPNMSERMENIYMTAFFYRLAFPWACFLAVFLGVPLATKNERSGIMMSIIIAVAMIIIYIICAQAFMLLGKRGILNPAVAGLAPTVLFILYGAYKVVYDKN